MTMHPTTSLRRRTLLVAAVLGAASLVAACGSSDSAGSSSGSAKAPTASGAWARTSAAMQSAGAAYLTLENTTDKEDALVKASAAATVAAKVEIHETVAADSAMTATTAMGGAATTAMGGAATTAMGGSATTATGGSMGAMKMQPVDKIVVPAKGKVELKPGGYHIMLLELPKPLVKGEKFDLTVETENSQAGAVGTACTFSRLAARIVYLAGDNPTRADLLKAKENIGPVDSPNQVPATFKPGKLSGWDTLFTLKWNSPCPGTKTPDKVKSCYTVVGEGRPIAR